MAAEKLHLVVENHDNKVIQWSMEEWFQSQYIHQMDQFCDLYAVMMDSSLRLSSIVLKPERD